MFFDNPKTIRLGSVMLALAASWSFTACSDDDSKSSGDKSRFRVTFEDAMALTKPDKEPAGEEPVGDEDAKPEDDADQEALDEDDSEDPAAHCKGFLDVNAEQVVTVTGSQELVELSPTDAMVIRVAGNQNGVNVKLEPADSSAVETTEGANLAEEDEPILPKIAGVCFRLTGNKSKATLSTKSVVLEKLGFIGRGNQPSVTLDIGDNSSVNEFMIDVKGNSGSIKISGTGEFNCPEASDSVSCEKTEKEPEAAEQTAE